MITIQHYRSGVIQISRIQGRDVITVIIRGICYAATSLRDARYKITLYERIK